MVELYLAGEFDPQDVWEADGVSGIPYLLQSYYWFRKHSHGRRLDYLDLCGQIMLDSGAFTFMEQEANDSGSRDWSAYVEEYAEFVREYDIDHFVELDIDSVVGHTRVTELRRKLEREVGRECIPIWHRSRGREAWYDLCEAYDYVGVGGIVANEISKGEYEIFRWLTDVAHEHDTKVHGMGFTPENVEYYGFDSVDSKSWLYGGLTNTVYQFTGSELTQHTKEDARRKHYKTLRHHNLREWVKYVRYMDAAGN